MARRGSTAEKPRRCDGRPPALAQRLPREPNDPAGEPDLLALTIAAHVAGDIE
jgi:hypothetical protein